jgi:hypothetical protein
MCALIALGLVASSSFASVPTYKCGTSADVDSAKNPVLLTLNQDGSVGVATAESPSMRNMERSNVVNTPEGYTAFTSETGCPKNASGMVTCGVMMLSTLYMTYPMVAGTPEGKAVLNGEPLYCAMQMMD